MLAVLVVLVLEHLLKPLAIPITLELILSLEQQPYPMLPETVIVTLLLLLWPKVIITPVISGFTDATLAVNTQVKLLQQLAATITDNVAIDYIRLEGNPPTGTSGNTYTCKNI